MLRLWTPTRVASDYVGVACACILGAKKKIERERERESLREREGARERERESQTVREGERERGKEGGREGEYNSQYMYVFSDQ